MKKDYFSWIKKDPFWIILFFIVLIITIVIFKVNGNTWATQVFAACLGAIITVIVTRLLLSKQSEIDEKLRKAEWAAAEQRRKLDEDAQKTLRKAEADAERKLEEYKTESAKELRELEEKSKRNFEIYNAKLKVYSSFVSKMYNILRDNEVTRDELLDLRTQILGQVSFYANGDILAGINDELSLKKVGDFRENIENIQRCFANIASLLQKDLRGNEWNADSGGAIKLWNTFDGLLDKFNETTQQPIVNTFSDDIASKCFNSTFWHFNMLGAEEQLRALSMGVFELNLIEYDEDWRTGLIKQVQENDLIFLFRAGGPGYMGVYRAKGWKIFQFNKEDGSTIETLNIFGATKQVINNPSDDEINKSDIYESKEDGATLCSSLIVEPLAFARTGVGNLGGVYRRTISRYDRGYGLMHLGCFMAIMDNEDIYNTYLEDGKKHTMGCNKELFKRILAVGNIEKAT